MSTSGDGLGGVRGSMRSPDDSEGIDAEFLGEGVDAGRGVREVCVYPFPNPRVLRCVNMRQGQANGMPG